MVQFRSLVSAERVRPPVAVVTNKGPFTVSKVVTRSNTAAMVEALSPKRGV